MMNFSARFKKYMFMAVKIKFLSFFNTSFRNHGLTQVFTELALTRIKLSWCPTLCTSVFLCGE